MKLNHLASLLLVSLVVACGGGGGSDQAQPPGGSRPPPGGGSGSGGGGSGGGGTGGGSTGTSSAEIVFPWRQSAATASTVTVRGTASDPDGVADVRVNGVGAAVTSMSASAQVSSPAAGVRKTTDARVRATSAAVLATEHDSEDVEWSAEVPLDAGENDIVVTVEDATGDVTEEADEVTVRYAEVPSPFATDADDPRTVGWSTTLTQAGEITRLVSFDPATGEQTVYPELTDVGAASCFRSHTEDFLYLTFQGGDVWHLRSFNLETRQAQPVAQLLPPLMSPGAGYSQGPFLIELVCSGVHDYVYVLANFWEDGDAVRSRVLRIDLAGNAEVLVETPLPNPGESPAWLAYTMGWGVDVLVGVYDLSPAAPLVRIPLDGSAPSQLAPATGAVGGLAVAPALDQGLVYVADFAGVYEVDVGAGTMENISEVGPTEPLIFSNPDSIAIDRVGNRITVGDSDLTALVAVDLDTGERSELLSRKVGAGPPMISPSRLALMPGSDVAYVADSGINAPERVFEVDLLTGDRRVIGPVHDGLVNRSLTGIAVDEELGHVYVARFDGGTVLRVDPEAQQVVPITTSGDGMLENIADLVLDSVNQRLLVADSATEAIVGVDVATLHKELISRAGDVGDGPAFERLASVTMGEDDGALYAADQKTNTVFRVDLETGDREVVDVTCPMSGPEVLRQVLYNAAAHELLILADGVFAYDLATAVCAQIPARFDPFVIRLTQDGRILAAGFNALTQIDRASGEVVIVSK